MNKRNYDLVLRIPLELTEDQGQEAMLQDTEISDWLSQNTASNATKTSEAILQLIDDIPGKHVVMTKIEPRKYARQEAIYINREMSLEEWNTFRLGFETGINCMIRYFDHDESEVEEVFADACELPPDDYDSDYVLTKLCREYEYKATNRGAWHVTYPGDTEETKPWDWYE
jgi:hypothetical protein